MTHHHRQSGTAIFMALLVVSLVTSLSILWYEQTKMNLKETTDRLNYDQIYLYTKGVLGWAVAELKINDQTPKILPNTLLPFSQGVITGRVDNRSRLNANRVNSKIATATSNEYFILRSEILSSNQHIILYSLLHRTNINGQINVSLLWQSHGVF